MKIKESKYIDVTAFAKFMKKSEKVLDLGCGQCIISKRLKDKGFNVTSVDVSARSLYPDIKPIIYDGYKLPFKDKEFDACLIIAVLHHTPVPELVLKEALRVSKKVIIREDIYSNKFDQFYAYFIDSVLNKEFIGHPHSNKNDIGWRKLFKKLNLNLIKADYFKSWKYLQNVDYYLR
jgi:ubiquinone/menaquinone biosynthesis C-methylase UbiE